MVEYFLFKSLTLETTDTIVGFFATSNHLRWCRLGAPPMRAGDAPRGANGRLYGIKTMTYTPEQ